MEAVLGPKEKAYSLSGGDFFKKNPEKVLAEPYEASGRFGKVTKYRPKQGMSITDTIKQISTPEFTSAGSIDLTAGKSVIMPDIESIPNPDMEQFIDTIKDATIKGIARKRKDKFVSWDEPEQKELQSFTEVLKSQNLEVLQPKKDVKEPTVYKEYMSIEEIKVFLWYIHSIGLVFEGEWLNIYNPGTVTDIEVSNMIRSWAKQGLINYFEGRFYPKAIYLSGNLYEKENTFKTEKAEIASAYGQDVADMQGKVIKEGFSIIYNRRLQLADPVESKRLKLKPFAEFCKKTMIGNWELESESGLPKPFLVMLSTAEKSYGEIFWRTAKSSLREWDNNTQNRNELSIFDAFKYWLRFAKERPKISHNMNWDDIFKLYLDKTTIQGLDPTVLAKRRDIAKGIGEKLFAKFLSEVITENDRVKIELQWNMTYFSDIPVAYDKIPVAFTCAKYYPKTDTLDIRPEKREAAAFHTLSGSSLNGYGVGVGKTLSAIFSIAQSLSNGHCKRPVIIVPNQVYKQFMSELKGALPNRKINDLYNLSPDYISKLYNEEGKVEAVEAGSISMMSIQGFERIGYKQETIQEMMVQLRDAISMLIDITTKKGQKEGLKQDAKIEEFIGKALTKTIVEIEDLGFDFACFDEAHAYKNIFSSVKARRNEDDEAEKKMYDISGSVSGRGIKAYFFCSHIQRYNKGRNILLLTATPFTNNPLEVYSMLSLVAYNYMREHSLSNINDFFDNFCQMSTELIINSKLKPERKNIFKGFENLVALRKLIRKFMLFKEVDKVDASGKVLTINRPDKWVIPLKKSRLIKGIETEVGEDLYTDTVLPLTELQKAIMEEVIQYVEGKMSFEQLCALRGTGDIADDKEDPEASDDKDTKKVKDEDEAVALDEVNMDDKEKAGVRTIRGVGFSRSIALSPYLYDYSGLGKPTYKEYIEKSPKLSYIIKCITSVKKWHEDKTDAVSGQVIYMDRGKKYMPLIKDYLVNVIGYKEHEVEIISSGKYGSTEHKELTKNRFNGQFYNESLKSFTDIPDSERIKVLIGTGSIKEGMNLQRYTTVLYNAFVDWRPTDEMQLEGRVWRQGNTFANVRIVIPLMSDSMDIFMFGKLEQKTKMINSLQSDDDGSNYLPIEELDPHEQKMKLVTDPAVIARLEVERDITNIDEEVAGYEANIQQAHNIAQFMVTRDEFVRHLTNIIEIIAPDKRGLSIDGMAKTFEKILEGGKFNGENLRNSDNQAIRESVRSSPYLTWQGELHKPSNYGLGKASVKMLEKAKSNFFDKFGVSDSRESLKEFVDTENLKIGKAKEHKEYLESAEFVMTRATEIEQERKERKISFASVDERVKEFEKLNYLLGIKAEDKTAAIQQATTDEISQCPPMTEDGKRDISPEAIRRLEHCLEMVPETKAMYTDADGNYTPERLALHKRLAAKMFEKTQCAGKNETPVAILMGGIPGSSKTTYLKKYAPFLTEDKIFKIDADAIREQLPEYEGWKSKATHLEARDIYHGLLDKLSSGDPCKYDILWDGTMNKAENYKPIIGKLKKLGYKIFCIYLSVPGDVARERVLKRYQNSGRYVPLEVINAAIEQGEKGFEVIKHLIDGYMKVDGVTHEVKESQGMELLGGRGYFAKEAEGDEEELEMAKAKAAARARRIRLLTL